MLIEPSSESSPIKETRFSLRLLFVRKGPYQYVDMGLSDSILAHQAKPSLFPSFLINVLGHLRPLILVKFYTIS